VQTNPASCPAGSRIGGGSATAQLNTGQTVTPTIVAYNGPNGNKIFLRVTEPTFNVNAILDGTLKTDTGKYGRKLDVLIPPNLQNVGGIIITLTTFKTTVGGTRKGTPFVGLKGCSGGKLSYKGDFFYSDNTSKSATKTGTCRAS
jgi:hypothetical protein